MESSPHPAVHQSGAVSVNFELPFPGDPRAQARNHALAEHSETWAKHYLASRPGPWLSNRGRSALRGALDPQYRKLPADALDRVAGRYKAHLVFTGFLVRDHNRATGAPWIESIYLMAYAAGVPRDALEHVARIMRDGGPGSVLDMALLRFRDRLWAHPVPRNEQERAKRAGQRAIQAYVEGVTLRVLREPNELVYPYLEVSASTRH